MKHPFTISSFAIIHDEQNRVLLCLMPEDNVWTLPGGGLESGESPWDCIIREVKEETGLDVTINRLVGIYTRPDTDKIDFLFACTVVGGNISLNNEAKDIQYFAVNEIPSNMRNHHAERILDGLSKNTELITKIQNTR